MRSSECQGLPDRTPPTTRQGRCQSTAEASDVPPEEGRVTPHLRELLLEWTPAPEWTPAEGCWRRREGGRWGGAGRGGEAPLIQGAVRLLAQDNITLYIYAHITV
ncbi:Exocyst complex component SEC10 [Zea mays]|uniref:Exocyst complex component SEC10 n=1 Tax=Zea mays TaxID=4577 RepID=A0A1D6MUI7_MAIZE|nr:Exocyst complex component SEC10 [Zea mays]